MNVDSKKVDKATAVFYDTYTYCLHMEITEL